LSKTLLLNRRPDATERLVDFGESLKHVGAVAARKEAEEWRNGTVEERLSHALVKGIDHLTLRWTRGGARQARSSTAGDRRPADGMYERGGRSVWRGQDVSAAGSQVGSK